MKIEDIRRLDIQLDTAGGGKAFVRITGARTHQKTYLASWVTHATAAKIERLIREELNI